MKKFAIAIAMILLVASSAYAGIPIGTIAPEAEHFSVGFDVGFGNVDLDDVDADSVNQTLKSVTYMVDLSYAITDQFELYATIGGASRDLEIPIVPYGDPSVTIDGGNAFAVGGGFRAVLYDNEQFFVKAQGGYLYSGKHDLEDVGDSMRVHEWQAALLGGMHFDQISPYVGVEYYDNKLKFKTTTDSVASGNVCVVVGGDFEIQKNFYLNLEGQFIDQATGSAGFTYRF